MDQIEDYKILLSIKNNKIKITNNDDVFWKISKIIEAKRINLTKYNFHTLHLD